MISWACKSGTFKNLVIYAIPVRKLMSDFMSWSISATYELHKCYEILTEDKWPRCLLLTFRWHGWCRKCANRSSMGRLQLLVMWPFIAKRPATAPCVWFSEMEWVCLSKQEYKCLAGQCCRMVRFCKGKWNVLTEGEKPLPTIKYSSVNSLKEMPAILQ